MQPWRFSPNFHANRMAFGKNSVATKTGDFSQKLSFLREFGAPTKTLKLISRQPLKSVTSNHSSNLVRPIPQGVHGDRFAKRRQKTAAAAIFIVIENDVGKGKRDKFEVEMCVKNISRWICSLDKNDLTLKLQVRKSQAAKRTCPLPPFTPGAPTPASCRNGTRNPCF